MRDHRTHHQHQPVELLDARDVRPHIAWSTLARAERLAHQGHGWSADHVLRRALHALERERLEGTKA